jgi:hypothetical protein
MNGNARERASQASLSCDKLQVRSLRGRNISLVMLGSAFARGARGRCCSIFLMLKGAVNYIAEPPSWRGFW